MLDLTLFMLGMIIQIILDCILICKSEGTLLSEWDKGWTKVDKERKSISIGIIYTVLR